MDLAEFSQALCLVCWWMLVNLGLRVCLHTLLMIWLIQPWLWYSSWVGQDCSHETAFFFLHCSQKCSSSYSLYKCGEPAPPRFHVPEITFLDSVCTEVRTSAYKVVHLLVSFPLSLTPLTMLYWRREPSIWHHDKCGGNLSTSKKMLRFYYFFLKASLNSYLGVSFK